MLWKRKPVHIVQIAEGKRNIIRQLLEKYDIESITDIQDALIELLEGTIKEMIEFVRVWVNSIRMERWFRSCKYE